MVIAHRPRVETGEVSLALGGVRLADIATLREHTAVFGKVPSDPTISRLITTLAADAPAVLSAIDTARAKARASAWTHGGEHAPDHDITADNPIWGYLPLAGDIDLGAWPTAMRGACELTR